jgi:hypothetical protein
LATVTGGCDIRTSKIRNFILHSFVVLLVPRWLILKERMDHRLHEECSAGCKRQVNAFPEIPVCVSIALDKESNLNYNSKWFSLYDGLAC